MLSKIKVDSLGRVIIPSMYRHAHNLTPGDSVEIFIEYGSICIKPFEPENLNLHRCIAIVRRIDNLNRICIPTEYFTTLGWKKNEFYYVNYRKDSYEKEIAVLLSTHLKV